MTTKFTRINYAFRYLLFFRCYFCAFLLKSNKITEYSWTDGVYPVLNIFTESFFVLFVVNVQWEFEAKKKKHVNNFNLKYCRKMASITHKLFRISLVIAWRQQNFEYSKIFIFICVQNELFGQFPFALLGNRKFNLFYRIWPNGIVSIWLNILYIFFPVILYIVVECDMPAKKMKMSMTRKKGKKRTTILFHAMVFSRVIFAFLRSSFLFAHFLYLFSASQIQSIAFSFLHLRQKTEMLLFWFRISISAKDNWNLSIFISPVHCLCDQTKEKLCKKQTKKLRSFHCCFFFGQMKNTFQFSRQIKWYSFIGCIIQFDFNLQKFCPSAFCRSVHCNCEPNVNFSDIKATFKMW